MYRMKRASLWALMLMLLVSGGALAFVGSRYGFLPRRAERKPEISSLRVPSSGQSTGRRSRNLSLSPESFQVSHRLGQRFSAEKRNESVLLGRVTLGSTQRAVQTMRKQSDDGEQIEISVEGWPGLFTWSSAQGVMYSGARPDEANRALIERLVFDSPDQFVLAQLRGASYYTVARNVRPPEASDGYSGPLWNIVRVNDPESDEAKRPRSRWRLYYINTKTGLIERIVSSADGQQVTATLVWAEVQGEKVPVRITWKRQHETIMQYALTDFAYRSQ